MLLSIKEFISPSSTWLTIGDGRYGTDANFLQSHEAINHASDIFDVLLKIGREIGFIGQNSSQNAEALKFEDESFDYVLIKVALHHCPRPWIALYEAFRAYRKAVILIEPNDDWTYLRTFLGSFKNFAGAIKRLAKFSILNEKASDGHCFQGFEPVGNYLYRFNQTELEKFCLL